MTAALAGSNAYRALLAFSGGPGEVWTDPFMVFASAATPLYLIGGLLLSAAILRTRALGRWSVLPLLLSVLPTLLRLLLIHIGLPVQNGPQAVRDGMTTLVIVSSPELLNQACWVVIGFLMWRSSREIPAGREATTVDLRNGVIR